MGESQKKLSNSPKWLQPCQPHLKTKDVQVAGVGGGGYVVREPVWGGYQEKCRKQGQIAIQKKLCFLH